MTHQLVISEVHQQTLCIPIEDAQTLALLQETVYKLAGIDPLDQRFLLNGRDLDESVFKDAISQKSDFLSLKFVLKGGCVGGKGGFGSLLRSAKSSKKTTNFGSCRDLNGRRIRDIQYEKKIMDWTENQEGGNKKRVNPRREQYLEEEALEEEDQNKEKERREMETKNITKRVEESVEKGLAIQKEKAELKRKREEESSIKLFGMEDDISESDLTDSEEEVEQKSKRHCPTSIEFVKSSQNNVETTIPNELINV